MPLVLDIVVDPSKAAPEVVKLTRGLNGVVQVAEQASKAISKAGDTTAKAFGKAEPTLIATTKTLSTFRFDADKLGKELEDNAKAWEHEEDILERIHGPAQRYMQDLKALDSLLSKNKISTEQYADEVARLNKSIETSPRRVESGGVPEAPSGGGFKEHIGEFAGLGGQAGTMVAGLLSGGAMGVAVEGLGMIKEAITNVGEAAAREKERLREFKDGYIEIANATGKFKDATHSTNDVIRDQEALAFGLHAKLGETIELYDAVRGGTDGLNYSYRDQIRLAEVLGKSVQGAGKQVGEASSIMESFSYALAAGHMSGAQLETMMKKIGPLADIWTAHFGKTRVELARLVDDGTISVKQLADALVTDGGKADESFKGVQRTTRGWTEELKNTYALARGQGKTSLEAMDEALKKTADSSIALADRQRVVNETLGDAENPAVRVAASYKAMQAQFTEIPPKLTPVADILDRTARNLQNIATQAESAHAKLAIWTNLAPVADVVNKMSYELGQLGEKLADMPQVRALGLGQQRADEVREATINLKALREAHDLDAKSVVDFKNKERALLDIINGVTPKMKEQAKAARDLARALLGSETPADRAIRAGIADRAHNQSENELIASIETGTPTAQLELFNAKLAQLDDLQQRAMISAEGYATAREKAFSEAFDNGILAQHTEIDLKGDPGWKAAVEAQEQLRREAREGAEQTRLAWLNAAGQIGGAFIKAAMDGKTSFKDMTMTMLHDIAMVLLKMAALNMAKSGGTVGTIGTILGAGLGGFSHGGDIPPIPFAANGADWRVIGQGGTDSKLAMFHVSPNESIHVRTPEQRAAVAREARGGYGPVGATGPAQIFNVWDRRALLPVLSSPDGHRAILNVIRANPGVVRGLLAG